MKRLCPWFIVLVCCKNAPVKETPKKVTLPASQPLPTPPKPVAEKTNFFRMDTLAALPDGFTQLAKGEIRSVFRVDFTGDGKPDFICQYSPPNKPDSIYYVEKWITSARRVVKTINVQDAEIEYSYFVNLDKDPEPEIFRASGFHDGVDYFFEDQDLSTGEAPILFYCHPVLLENGKRYWGYPRDIRDIAMKNDSGHITIQASWDHDITDDGESSMDTSIKKIPAVFFYGHHTQRSSVEDIRNIKWMTLDELKLFRP